MENIIKPKLIELKSLLENHLIEQENTRTNYKTHVKLCVLNVQRCYYYNTFNKHLQ